MSLLSDQLLKVGLVTEEQVKKAAEKPKKKQDKKAPTKNASKNANKNKQPVTSKDTDLALFYKQRASQERKEKQEAEKKKKAEEKVKKETNDKINKLILDNLLNDEAADIRYNFVVGKTIKYLFVNEKQQQMLSDGELAIIFLGGKRALIPATIARDIQAINPNKIVIITEAIASANEESNGS